MLRMAACAPLFACCSQRYPTPNPPALSASNKVDIALPVQHQVFDNKIKNGRGYPSAQYKKTNKLAQVFGLTGIKDSVIRSI